LFSHAPCTLICGVYLILSGIFRFVEESLRGEPQTPVRWRLRLYQWIALASIVAGAVVTTLGSQAAPRFTPQVSSFFLAAACGIAGWFVSGVDFPESNRRFARLT
jgi:prolipoprotein diacylglyceryltransferase